MEALLAMALIIFVAFQVARKIERNSKRIERTFRPRSKTRRLPSRIRPNDSHKRTPSGPSRAARSSNANARKRNPKTASGASLDETPWAQRQRGVAVTNGVEHALPPEVPVSRTLAGRAWVIDGDTIAISRIKIRLAGIDAPELDEPWGRKSKWAMVNLCKGQTIHVELTGETSYDRLVGTCYLPDGTDVGAKLVEQGLALDGGYYSKGKYRHLEPDGARNRLKYYGLRQGK